MEQCQSEDIKVLSVIKMFSTLVKSRLFRGYFKENPKKEFNILMRSLANETIYERKESDLFLKCLNNKKPSDKLIKLFKKDENLIKKLKIIQVAKIHYFLQKTNTENLDFYEKIVETLMNSEESEHEKRYINFHYLVHGKNPETLKMALTTTIQMLKWHKYPTFQVTYFLLKHLHTKEVDCSPLATYFRLLIMRWERVDEIEKVMEFFKDFYKYSMTFDDFYYPIAKFLISFDSNLTPIKVSLFLHCLNINPCSKSLSLLNDLLTPDCTLSNKDIAKILYKTFVLFEKNSTNFEELSSFYTTMDKIFMKNFINYSSATDIQDAKIIFFVLKQWNTFKSFNMRKVKKIQEVTLDDSLAKLICSKQKSI
jgi:hypothetical protein